MPIYIDFFLSLASTYTYLSVHRDEEHANRKRAWLVSSPPLRERLRVRNRPQSANCH